MVTNVWNWRIFITYHDELRRMGETKKTLRLNMLDVAFEMPKRVALEKGYFEEEGLDTELVVEDTTVRPPSDIHERADTEEKKENKFLDQEINSYAACEWGSLQRTNDLGEGKIGVIYNATDGLYAIYTRPDTEIEKLEDLAETPIAVNHWAGSHYATLKLLEDVLPRDKISLTQTGHGGRRFKALRDKEVSAAVLLEPFQTLADDSGFYRLGDLNGGGCQVFAEEFDKASITAFIHAYNQAVDEINDNPNRYQDEFLEALEIDSKLFEEDEITAERFSEKVNVPKFSECKLAEPDRLQETYTWMQTWDLIDGTVNIKQLTI